MKMVVYGFEVTAVQQDAARTCMRQGPFQAKDVFAVLMAHGVPEMVVPPGKNPMYRHNQEFCASRTTDRLLRSESKLGNIVRVKQAWWPREWKPAASPEESEHAPKAGSRRRKMS